MKVKIISVLCAIALLLSLPVAAADTEADEVMAETYKFFTEEMGFCPAAAAGIMGNIMIESNFIPDRGAMDVNDKYSYGLVMWNGPRYESLMKWCKENKFDYKTAKGQLAYLKWELENSERRVSELMREIPNTIEGACRAATLWADEFERCTKVGYGLRIYYAINVFWQDYAGGTTSNTPGIFGYYYNVPDNVKFGTPMTVYGAVVSYASRIKSVTAGVYDADGNLVTGKKLTCGNLVGNLGVSDIYVVFNSLKTGNYYYMISAENEKGYYVVDRHPFTVSLENTEYTLVAESKGGAMCSRGAGCPGLRFTDMPPATNWAHDGIDFALDAGLMGGVSDTSFSPSGSMTRAMFVTVLSRISDVYFGGVVPGADGEDPIAEPKIPDIGTTGVTDETGTGAETDEPAEEPQTVFSDVTENKWFYSDVMWAYSLGLVNGTSPDTFSPNSAVTRAQLATLLKRFSDVYGIALGGETEAVVFADADEVPEWAADAMTWAVANGLIAGEGSRDGSLWLKPDDVATRAQVAIIFQRFLEKIIAADS
ncbi:MAG: phage tail tip lysozyme [Clostridia bacterium]|nr:phage tail tip lysozyme [Clostridia bacterium]